MKAEQLRKSILQLAIQGKLVKQDPNDEPASVLLERIRAEKQRLIKEGKIKKDKCDSIIFKGDDNCYYEKIGKEIVCIDEEVADFDIPESWCLCRMSTIANIYTGNSINETEKQRKYVGLPDGYNYIATKDVSFEHSINYENGVKIPFSENNFRIAYKNTPLLCIEGGSAGRKIAILEQDVCFGNKLCAFQALGVNPKYLYYYLQNPLFIQIFKSKTTGIIGGVSVNTLKTLIFALPPLPEQARIVEEIERFEPLLIQYDRLENQATKLDSEIYDKLKKSILQYAIQGKLVEQDENDEPASVLLERIRAEKKVQLGKKYVESYIYKGDDNCYYEKVGKNKPVLLESVPFDIPTSWAWSRLSAIIDLQSGRDLEPSQYNSNKVGIPYITGASNIDNEEIIINRWTQNPVVISKQGELLITCKGTIGTMAFNNIGDIHIARQIMSINSNFVHLDYIRLFLESYVSSLQAVAKSMIPGINRDDILQALIPIPPVNEQIRIIQRVYEIKSKIKGGN